MKRFAKTAVLFWTITVLFFSPAAAQEKEKPKRHPSPDWVHPKMRKNYPGYEEKKRKKKNSPMWKYSTNRPTGNIRGGGTTEYKDYRPFFTPDK